MESDNQGEINVKQSSSPAQRLADMTNDFCMSVKQEQEVDRTVSSAVSMVHSDHIIASYHADDINMTTLLN